jgi:hypothetical protein
VHAEVHAAQADHEGQEAGDAEEIGLQHALLDELREEGAQGQIDDGGEHRVAGREARRRHVREVRHEVRARPRECELQRLREQEPPSGRHQDEGERVRLPSHGEEYRHGGGEDEEHDIAAERSQVAHRAFDPGRPDRVARVGRAAEDAQDRLVDAPGIAFPDLGGDLQEHPNRGHREQGAQEQESVAGGQAPEQRSDGGGNSVRGTAYQVGQHDGATTIVR